MVNIVYNLFLFLKYFASVQKPIELHCLVYNLYTAISLKYTFRILETCQ